MTRDFAALERRFDLLVVGGGIYGAWVAYDAALRGLDVALVERHDWASGTSSASSKLIHGGLRYLEQGRFALVRKALRERSRLMRLAPHRVRPLRFWMPRYAGERPGRAKLRVGLWLYDHIARADAATPAHQWIDGAEILRSLDLRKSGLRGALAFSDCGMDDARLALEIVSGALGAGVVAVNRARVSCLTSADSRISGAAVECLETGASACVRARVTMVAAGAWTADLVPQLAPKMRRTKGVHLVLPGLGVPEALLLGPGPDRRIVFAIPWYGRTLLGTTDTDFDGAPDTLRVEPEDLSYLLDRAGRVLRTPWTPRDVIASFAGLRTLPAAGPALPSAVSREWSLLRPNEGLFVSFGGKFTSARADAAMAVDAALQALGRPHVACRTGELPFPWCPAGAFEPWRDAAVRRGIELGADPGVAQALALRHGARVDRLHERLARNPELARRIVPDAPFCSAEVPHAAEAEMALTLEDILRRRVPLLLIAPPPRETLLELARLAGHSLGWSAERTAREVESLV